MVEGSGEGGDKCAGLWQCRAPSCRLPHDKKAVALGGGRPLNLSRRAPRSGKHQVIPAFEHRVCVSGSEIGR